MTHHARILAGLLLSAVSLLAPSLAVADILPEPELLLNDYGTTDSGDTQVEDWDAEIATDGAGNVVAVWTSNSLPSSSPENYTVRMVHAASSTDGGATWSSPAQLNVIDPEEGSVNGIHPHIVTDGGGTWIASWASGSMWLSDASTTDIVVSRSTNNGQTWSTPATIPHPEGGTTRAKDHPAIAADGAGNWVAVWHASVPTNSDKDIYASSSSDNGVTWSSAIMINSNGADDDYPGVDAEPSIATDGAGTWLAVWHSNDAWDGNGESSRDTDIVLSKSTDNGATWSVEVLVNSNSADTTGPDLRPMIATDGLGNWLTCWYKEAGVSELVAVSRSTDTGATWSTLTTPTAGISTNYGRLATDGAGHWLLMARKSSGFMLQQSTDAGLNWSSKLSTTQGLSERDIAVAIGADGAAVALQSDATTRGADIILHRSSDFGVTWDAQERLDETAILNLPANDTAPLLATDGNGVWVSAWTTRYGSTSEPLAAWAFARSEDDGDFWSPATLIPVPGMNYDTRAVKTSLVTDGAGTWLLPVIGGASVLRSEDNGLTWSEPIPVSELFGFDANRSPYGNLTLAANGDGVWIIAAEVYSEGNTWVYGDSDIYLSRSEDDGLTWSAPLPAAAYMGNDSGWMPDNTPATNDITPAIAADGTGNWALTWRRGTLASPGIPRVYSNDNGLTWSTVADIETRGLTQQVEHPVLRTHGAGNWVACWLVYTRTSSGTGRAAPYQIYTARSTNGGATWTAPQLLDDGGTSDIPKQDLDLAMGADGGCLVTWSSEALDGDLDVFAVHSTDSGATWTAPGLLNSDAESEAGATDRGACIASGGADKWMVVWESDHDLINGSIDDADIHYTRLGDGWSTEGAVEGLSEGMIEGNTEGVIEGIAEGNTEGVIEGQIEGSPEGSLEGVLEGTLEGEAEGIAEGGGEGVEEGSGEGQQEGEAEGTQEGIAEGATEGIAEGAGEGEVAQRHSIDIDGDGALSLSEVLRGIQLYNSGNFSCAEGEGGSEDGFSLGDGTKLCPPHAGDYNPQDWFFSISELLRMIQFYNLGGLHPCPVAETEDGFCPGPQS
jgi:Neuraminidase (sialidase)